MKIHTKNEKTYISAPIHNGKAKQAICDQLCKVIQMTAAGDDLVALRYDPVEEYVHADFRDHYDLRQINVGADSGWAMIKDIVRQIDIG